MDNEKMYDWFKEHADNLRTGSNIAVILFIVLYFYGFRSGFQFYLHDISDMVMDILIMLVAAYMIMSDFARRGIATTLKEDEKENGHINEALAKHQEAIDTHDPDILADGINKWNAKEKKRAIEEKKQRIAERYKEKRRRWLTKKDGFRKKRKLKKYDKLIKHYTNPDTVIRARYQHVTEKHLKKKTAYREKGTVVGAKYDPHRDTVMSQTGIVVMMLVATSMLRVMVDPTSDNIVGMMMFLAILIPFLVVRAIISYQVAIYNTKEKYPLALQERTRIIRWCMKEGEHETENRSTQDIPGG